MVEKSSWQTEKWETPTFLLKSFLYSAQIIPYQVRESNRDPQPIRAFQMVINLLFRNVQFVTEKLFETSDGALMSLHFSLPAMADGIFDKLSLSLATTAQTR